MVNPNPLPRQPQDVVGFFDNIRDWVRENQIDRQIERLGDGSWSMAEAIFSRGTPPTALELDTLATYRRNLQNRLLELAAQRQLPFSEPHEPNKAIARILQEASDIHFQNLAGPGEENFRGGYIGKLVSEINSDKPNERDSKTAARKIAFDFLSSETLEIRQSKLNIVRANLGLIGDRTRQEAAIKLIADELGQQRAMGTNTITKSDFVESVAFSPQGYVTHFDIPERVKDYTLRRKELMPNIPISDNYAEIETFQTAIANKMLGGMKRMSQLGQNYFDELPNDPRMKIAINTDHNNGVKGEPTVTPPLAVYGKLMANLQYCKELGKDVWFSVGDLNGLENCFLGRFTIDTLRETGTYHYALKAGLEFAKTNAPTEAERQNAETQLTKLIDLEKAGKFFGSSAHRNTVRWLPTESTKARRNRMEEEIFRPVEDAAQRYVRVTDYQDRTRIGSGFTTITPELGPVELGIWGARKFGVATDWYGSPQEKVYGRERITRGPSDHTSAGITGPLKGMIGLALTGLRPLDQGLNEMGRSPLDTFPDFAGALGFFTIFQRLGIGSADFTAAVTQDPELKECLRNMKSKDVAYRAFSDEMKKVRQEVSELREGKIPAMEVIPPEMQRELETLRGKVVPEPLVMEFLTNRVRDALDRANDKDHGFGQLFWETARVSTEVAMRFGRNVPRQLFPEQTIDEAIGNKIGVQTHMMPQPNMVTSLLSVTAIQKDVSFFDHGAGPDGGFKELSLPKGDHGHLIMSTSSVTNELLANDAAGLRMEDTFKRNFPLFGTAIVTDEVPIHPSLVRRM